MTMTSKSSFGSCERKDFNTSLSLVENRMFGRICLNELSGLFQPTGSSPQVPHRSYDLTRQHISSRLTAKMLRPTIAFARVRVYLAGLSKTSQPRNDNGEMIFRLSDILYSMH